MRATLAFGVLILLASPVLARTWTDASGTFTIEADLVSVENDVVVLLRHSDNKQIRIPLAKLSKADQDFVKNPSGAAPKEGKTFAGDGVPPTKDEARKPLTKEEIQVAEAAVNDLFKDDIVKARTLEQKGALANKLLTTATADQERANRYVLFKKAAELAVNAGNTKLTLESLDSLDKVQFSPSVWEETLGILATKNPEDLDSVFDKVDALIRKCYALDDYDSANKLAGLLPTFAKIAKSPELQNRANARVSEVFSAGDDFKRHVVAARAVLEKNPAEPAANLIVGKFLCFVRMDWDRGLSMLALGSDATLKNLAALERREPKTPADMVSLGDGWWLISETEAGSIKTRIKSRASYWYKKAVPELAGLAKVKAEKRLTEIAAASPENTVMGSDDAIRDKLDDVIENGLRWLAIQQKDDGSWDLNGGTDPSKLSATTAGTALALLPFLRSGQTPLKGVHNKVVAKGLAFIQNRMLFNEHGCQSPDKECNMYGQAIITMVLCEAFSRTKDQKLRQTAQGAVNFIIYAQNPNTGGWRYKPRDQGDTSVVGWQLQALIAASQAQLKFPQQSFALADRFLDSTQKDGGSAYAYDPSKESTPSMSAVGLLCRTWTRGKRQPPGFAKGIEFLAAKGPTSMSESVLYYDYYAGQSNVNSRKNQRSASRRRPRPSRIVCVCRECSL